MNLLPKLPHAQHLHRDRHQNIKHISLMHLGGIYFTKLKHHVPLPRCRRMMYLTHLCHCAINAITRAPRVLGSQVQSLLEVNFLLNLFYSLLRSNKKCQVYVITGKLDCVGSELKMIMITLEFFLEILFISSLAVVTLFSQNKCMQIKCCIYLKAWRHLGIIWFY